MNAPNGRDIRRMDPCLLGTVAVTFAIHLSLIGWNRAEYTDGYLQLALFSNENTYLPPLYTALTHIPRMIGMDPVYAGRFVSIIVSSLVLLPLFALSSRLFSIRVARYAILVYAVMAVPNRWSLRVMTDPAFTLFFVWGVLAFIKSLENPGRIGALAELMLASGLATLTRYQGMVLLPLVICAAWQSRTALREQKAETGKAAAALFIGMLPWLLLGIWMNLRGMSHAMQFEERLGSSALETFLRYLDMAQTFVLFFPYAITYPLFLAMLYGLVKSDTHHQPQRNLLLTLLYIFPVWLLVHSAFQSFQYRYFLPIMPFVALYAARGLVALEDRLGEGHSLRRAGTAISLLFSLAFSILVLVMQRDTFADYADTGRYIREHFPTGRVYSDEFYGPPERGVLNVKMEYYAGRKVEFLFDEVFQIRRDLKPGDVIVLHNTAFDLRSLPPELVNQYKLDRVHVCQYRGMPLLPDIMTDPPITSQPRCMAYRFQMQRYEAAVYRVGS